MSINSLHLASWETEEPVSLEPVKTVKIKSLNLALASAVTAAALWTACSLMVWLMPGAIMSITRSMVHLEVGGSGWTLSPVGFVWGLIAWSFFAGIFAWLLATIYNLLNRNTKD
jgi:hypothetical protein